MTLVLIKQSNCNMNIDSVGESMKTSDLSNPASCQGVSGGRGRCRGGISWLPDKCSPARPLCDENETRRANRIKFTLY